MRSFVSVKGSMLGVGTDIGGSVRAPSAFCDIYGFKPTSYILPIAGFLVAPFAAELNILCSIGPMCRNVSKVGIVSNDGFIEPQPPVKRAISWANGLLADPKQESLVEVKNFNPFGAEDAWRKIRRFYWPEGGSLTKSSILAAGEPLHPQSEWIWKDAEPAGMQTAEDLIRTRKERDEFRCAFARDWQEQDVDVVIGPAFVGPACAHDTVFYWTYTSLYHLVDYPAVVIPTPLKVKPGEQYEPGYTPLSEACRHVKQLWESSDFEGAPLALQVVARKYHDSELFGALAI